MVRPPGIEPGSRALQAPAMTTSAKVASGRRYGIRTRYLSVISRTLVLISSPTSYIFEACRRVMTPRYLLEQPLGGLEPPSADVNEQLEYFFADPYCPVGQVSGSIVMFYQLKLQGHSSYVSL